jgi:UDP-galactopyranose mutase
MNDEKNSELFEKYQNLAEKEDNVIFGGRLGMYQYFDMWQVIDEALKLARNLE